MKKLRIILSIIFFFVFGLEKVVVAQITPNSRWDYAVTTTNTTSGNLIPLFAIPNSPISFYTGCTSLPCTTPANVFPNSTTQTACPTNAQVVLQLTNTCVASSDSQGNFGGWFSGGTYQYTITIQPQGIVMGPYSFTVAGTTGTGCNQTNNTTIGCFTDLDTANAGGIAAATTEAEQAAVEHATALAAACWSSEHGGAQATFYKSSLYPAAVDNLYIGSNTDFYSTSIPTQTYIGKGSTIHEYILGSSGANGGNPAVRVDFSYTDTCNGTSVNLGGSNVDVQGFSIYNDFGSSSGGEADGIRVAATNVHVSNINCSELGGACFENATGVNNSYDWIYATNVAFWACQASNGGTQLTNYASAAALGGMVDGEAGHNQLSTGCGFGRGFHVNSKSYGYIAPMLVGGGGNDIHENLLQTDEIGLILVGQDHRVFANRSEYMSAELIRSHCSNCIFSMNQLISGALDSTAPVSGVNSYFGIYDDTGGSTYVGNNVGADAGVDGPSYYRGSFFFSEPEKGVGVNGCNSDSDDTYHNGHCYNGTNYNSTNYNGGAYDGSVYQDGTVITYSSPGSVPYVGNASSLTLTENSPVGLLSLSGMMPGGRIDVVSINTTETLTSGTFGIRPVVASCDGYNLITLKQNVHYQFQYDSQGNLSQTGCQTNPTKITLNYHQNTPPAAIDQGSLDLFGTLGVHGEPLGTVTLLENDISPGSKVYGYEIEYWAGGAHFITPVATIGLSVTPSNTPTTETNVGFTTPPYDCTSYNIYRASTTDPAVTTTGLLASGSCLGPTTVATTDYGQTVTGTVPTANINTSGRIIINTSATGAVTSSTNCETGKNELFLQNATLAYCWNGIPYVVTATEE